MEISRFIKFKKVQLAKKLLKKDFSINSYVAYAIEQFEKDEFNGFLSFLEHHLTNLNKEQLLELNSKLINKNQKVRQNVRIITEDRFSLSPEVEVDSLKSMKKSLLLARRSSRASYVVEVIETLGLINESLDKAIKEKVMTTISFYIKHYGKNIENDDLMLGLLEVNDVFNLNKIESDVIFFLYLVETQKDVSTLIESLSSRVVEFQGFIKLYCSFFDIHNYEISSCFSKKSKLVRSGIINLPRYTERLKMNRSIVDFLSNPGHIDLISSYITKDKEDTLLEKEDFLLDEDSISTIEQLLSSSRKSILFYGPPGCGKTQLARLLGKSLTENTYFLSQSNDEGEESIKHRKLALSAIGIQKRKENDIIIIDEADVIMKTKNFWVSSDNEDSKAWINEYLEKPPCSMIWIVNDLSQIHESTLRRFSFTMKFQRHGKKERISIIEKKLSHWGVENILLKNDIEDLAVKYELNAGDITRAIDDLAPDFEVMSREKFLKHLHAILKNKLNIYGKRERKNNVISNYDVTALNLNISPKVVIESLANYYSSSQSFVDNFNLLMHGPPGTGKSQLALYLAEQLNKEIIVLKGSDLLDPYVGGTEKKIANAFAQAEIKGAILFLDEAETFLSDRQGAQRHWQQSQTNEFLNGMERFKGCMIAATNYVDNIDAAILRRFSSKIEFKALSAKGNVAMAKRWFEDKLQCKISEKEIAVLESLEYLTPGDFKSVAYRNAFNRDIDCEHLIAELRSELEYKKLKKNIGL